MATLARHLVDKIRLPIVICDLTTCPTRFCFPLQVPYAVASLGQACSYSQLSHMTPLKINLKEKHRYLPPAACFYLKTIFKIFISEIDGQLHTSCAFGSVHWRRFSTCPHYEINGYFIFLQISLHKTFF